VVIFAKELEINVKTHKEIKMKKGYCHIVAIIDRSGSMSPLATEVINSFNHFIKDQRKVDGEATISLIQFDDQYEVNYSFMGLQIAPLLDKHSYSPRGMTAMFDAIGKTINNTGKHLANMKEDDRPDKVVVLIQTDGEENASKEFTSNTIHTMIKDQTDKYSWEFVFLGANINAKSTANNIGIPKKNAMTYTANSIGTCSAINSVSNNLTQLRNNKRSNMSYTSEDYAKQQESAQ
jgi:uncharacterized protein YegL